MVKLVQTIVRSIIFATKKYNILNRNDSQIINCNKLYFVSKLLLLLFINYKKHNLYKLGKTRILK